ncbi:MAG: TIGR03936 family radical SAM-associated protein [Elusimicrobiota bacterium]|nr:TIGR03936 family radical SAM-associated protein [Elusimicrobiota bacterium]
MKGNITRAISKIRVKYTKGKPLRFLTHLEVVSAIRQAVRRASLPVCISSGFSPQPKISFGPPLPVGYTSNCEIFDMEMFRRIGADEVEKSLSSSMPPALGIISTSSVPVVSKSVELLVNAAKYSIEIPSKQQCSPRLQSGVSEANIKIKDFFSAKEFLIERITDKSRRTIDVRPLMVYMKYIDGKIEMLLRFGPQKTAKPDVIIQKVFGLADDEKSELIINRDEFFYEMANGEIIKI